MRATAPERMTADEFIAWAMHLPDGEHYELVDGEVVAMAPERAVHVRVKTEMWLALRNAIRERGLGCEAFVDGLSVRVDEATVYEPDVLVHCGEPLDDRATEAPSPVIVVEVVSPSSTGVDTAAKFDGYFRLASVRHYLVVMTDRRVVLHHARDDAGTITSRVVAGGALRLEPPGLEVAVEALFAAR